MKKLFLGLFFILFSILTFSEYNYPYINPNVATIFGSSAMMTPGIPKKIPIKEYKIKLPWSKPVDESLWYNEGFRFSLVPQKKKAPLIFLLAGTGSSHNSIRMENFQRIFYKAGYHVISISSPMNNNFIINASSNQMPGIIMNDSKDIYEVMKVAFDTVSQKIEVTDFYLVGYSLGGTEASMISYIDEDKKTFNFKRVFVINPAVDVYKSALKLDNFLGFKEEERAEKIRAMIENIIDRLVKNSLPEHTRIDIETIYNLFAQNKMSNKEMEELIGTVFRLTAIDINYLTDFLNKRGIYVNEPVEKFSPMFPYFEKINFASFEDYINKLALPFFKEKYGKDLALKDFLEKSKMSYIEEYLKTSDKIAVVTNADELILDQRDIEYLKKTFKNRILIYPYGGHCGNMFFTPNVEIMLNFLEKGVLPNEI